LQGFGRARPPGAPKLREDGGVRSSIEFEQSVNFSDRVSATHRTPQFFFHLLADCDNISTQLVTASSLIASDPEILGGTPVFKGTRVPVRTLFEYLADGLSLEYFLESFPSVTREQAADVLRFSQERIEQEAAA
jgi:uncharacterized protein (DUF433 family)